MSELKAFRLLPYGTRFRYQGTQDVWVRTSHNLVAEWPGRLRTPTNEPIQSLCSFCHLDGDEDGNTLDTLVEVVDRDAELSALREDLAESESVVTAVSKLLAGVAVALRGPEQALQRHGYNDIPARVIELKLRLTAAEQRNADVERALAGMLFGFDDGVGRDWSADLLDFARKLIAAKEFKPAELVSDACTSCDGSGEYIDAIGDWRGYCSCPAGVALKNKPTESGASE